MITSVVLAHKVLPPDGLLPGIPEYEPGTGNLVRRVFLVREDDFFVAHTIKLSTQECGDVENMASELCIYGYVDYMDQFGVRHRAGYARRFDPRQNDRKAYVTEEQFNNRSNLNYVTQTGYNYDRPRKKGEGNDWDDPV